MKKLLVRWFPIAFSDITLTAEIPLLLIFIAYGQQPVDSVAAFGLILSFLTIYIIALQPIASVTTYFLTKDFPIKATRNFSVSVGALFSLVLGGIASAKQAAFVCNHIFHLSPLLSTLTIVGLKVFTPIPLIVSIRRHIEGAIIFYGNTQIIVLTVWIRLIITLCSAFLLCYTTHWHGITIGSFSLLFGLLGQTIAILFLFQKTALKQNKNTHIKVMTLIKFYVPLAMKALLQLLFLPIISFFLVYSRNTTAVLATWAVLYAMLEFLQSPCLEIENIALPLLKERDGKKQLRNFCTTLSFMTGLILLVFLISPFSVFFFQELNHLSPLSVKIAINSSYVAVVTIFLLNLRSYFYSMLIFSHRNSIIQNAALLNNLVLLSSLWITVLYLKYLSLYLAMICLSISTCIELIFLFCHCQRYKVGEIL